MGGNESKEKLSQKNIELLAQTTCFSAQEVQSWWIRYQQLTQNNNNSVKFDEVRFKEMLGIGSKPVSDRIFSAFMENNKNKNITFTDFIRGLSSISSRSPISEKAAFFFNIYDQQRTGFITKDDLFTFLNDVVESSPYIQLNELQMMGLVEKTFLEMDSDQDGRISFEEFKAYANSNPSIFDMCNLK